MRAYLQLVRLPAVFTAMADICLGFALSRGGFTPAQDLALLLAASCGLYLSGMAFNDVFDRRIDAVERPSRPIPSGRVSLRGAILLAVLLMAGGVAAAALVARQSLWIALGLAACVLAYDALLKGTPLGTVAMGGCRFLNVMLGASAFDSAADVWRWPRTIPVALALGIYILGVTLFARQEAGRSRPGALLASMGVVNLGLAGLIAWVLSGQSGAGDPLSTLVMLAVVLLTVNRRTAAALSDPAPAKVQNAVRIMLLSLIVLDATLVFHATGNPVLAVPVLLLLVPAMFLGRWIYIT